MHFAAMAKPALGRGLGALLGSSPQPAKPAPSPAATDVGAQPGDKVQLVALDSIRPCPLQPRQDFDPEGLRELADSIKEQGVIQPLLVRPKGQHFELIAGERRWRAAQLAGLKQVPVIVRQADDAAALEMALIENLQRQNLNPIEEAQGYHQLMELFDLRQEDVAARVGKSRAAVANALRLLKLPATVQAYVRDGRLSVGHAKVILALDDPTLQSLAAERVLKQGLSVRQTELLVARMQKQPGTSRGRPGSGAQLTDAEAHLADLAERLTQRFGTKVQLRYRAGKGAVEIQFFSDEELNRILEMLGVEAD